METFCSGFYKCLTSSWLFLLQISMWYLKIILFVPTYSNKLAPKTDNFLLNTKWHFNGHCLKRVKGHWRYLPLIPVWDMEKENCLHQKSLWNWQCQIHMKYGFDFDELQRNTEGLSSCLICYQLHWKVCEFSIFETYF